MDLLQLIFLSIYIIFDFCSLFKIESLNIENLNAIHSIALFICWSRLLTFSRGKIVNYNNFLGFEGTAFIMRTLITVAYDVRYFICIIFFFTVSLSFSGKSYIFPKF